MGLDVRLLVECSILIFFFFKQKTAYEMRISDWSSDVCSSDLVLGVDAAFDGVAAKLDLVLRHAQRFAGGHPDQIGRASCRGKSVSVRVDLGGRRIIKKKNIIST